MGAGALAGGRSCPVEEGLPRAGGQLCWREPSSSRDRVPRDRNSGDRAMDASSVVGISGNWDKARSTEEWSLVWEKGLGEAAAVGPLC